MSTVWVVLHTLAKQDSDELPVPVQLIDRQHGLKPVTANGDADLSTDGGRMFARIKAAVARSEVERKGAR